MSFFRLYPVFKLSFEHKSFRKNFFEVHVSVGILDFHHVKWTKKINLVERLVMVTRSCSPFFVISKHLDYMQCYMMLLEQLGHSGNDAGYC